MVGPRPRLREPVRRRSPTIPLFLNVGTTTEAVLQALLIHQNLTVVTNNMNFANILTQSENCDVIVAGGVLRRSDGGLVGDLTKEAIETFKVDFAIIATSGLDSDGDLLDFDSQEVRVSRAIIRQARRTFLVSDHSKLTRSAPVKVASLADIHTLFTDRRLPTDLAAKCAAWGTSVVVSSARKTANPNKNENVCITYGKRMVLRQT